MPLNPGDKLGPYEVLSLLGKGGMGEVYRARDPKLNRNVARSNRLTWGELLRCQNSADSITGTSAAPHKGIFGGIPSAWACALAPPST